jgi:choline transport protein
MCVIGWQAAMATTAFAATQQLQGLIALNAPSYVIQGWHTTLFAVAITAFAILWNTVFVRKLPLLEGIGLTLHVFGFFSFVVVLWVMGPRSDAKTVWTNFQDNSGWGSKGVATLVGILGPIVTLIGSDSSCHLSEELKDAAWVLPRAMVATALVNYALGFIMTVTIMSTLGDDIPGLLTTPLGQPWIQVLLNATESRVGTSILTAVLCLLLLFCAINQITTSSRQLFAFARDKGLPFSDFLARVRHIPSTRRRLLLTTLLGPSGLGRPCQRSHDNATFHDPVMSYYHRLDHCL